MLVICDVNEYRRLVKSFKVPMVNSLFEKLHALCNLLVVVPENIKSVITGEQLVRLLTCLILAYIIHYRFAKTLFYFGGTAVAMKIILYPLFCAVCSDISMENYPVCLLQPINFKIFCLILRNLNYLSFIQTFVT